MKNYKEISEMRSNVYSEIQTLTNKLLAIHDKQRGLSFEEYKKRSAETAQEEKELSDKIYDLEIEIRVLRNNYESSFKAYVMDCVKEILPKYAGKQCGEKTKERIRKEFNACGFGGYFEGSYSGGCYRMVAYPLDKNGYSHGDTMDIYACDDQGHTAYFINEHNTICETVPTFHNTEYIDNIPERIKEIKAAYSEYKTLCEKFNSAADRMRDLFPCHDWDRVYAKSLF